LSVAAATFGSGFPLALTPFRAGPYIPVVFRRKNVAG